MHLKDDAYSSPPANCGGSPHLLGGVIPSLVRMELNYHEWALIGQRATPPNSKATEREYISL